MPQKRSGNVSRNTKALALNHAHNGIHGA